MNGNVFKIQAHAAAPGSASAFLDTLERPSPASGVAARSRKLVRQVTDDGERPALVSTAFIAVAIALSAAVSWAVVHFHLS